jgi:hypothetical protein
MTWAIFIASTLPLWIETWVIGPALIVVLLFWGAHTVRYGFTPGR